MRSAVTSAAAGAAGPIGPAGRAAAGGNSCAVGRSTGAVCRRNAIIYRDGDILSKRSSRSIARVAAVTRTAAGITIAGAITTIITTHKGPFFFKSFGVVP